MDASKSNDGVGSAAPWLPLGKHRYRVIGAQFQFRTLGEITPADAEALMEHLHVLSQRSARCTLLFDVRDGLSAPPETRRAFVQMSSSERPSIPTAVLGTGILVRTLFRLTVDAARIMTRRNIVVDFFSTEEEAQAWLQRVVSSHYGTPREKS